MTFCLGTILEVKEKKSDGNFCRRAFFVKAGPQDIKPHEEILLKLWSKSPEWMSLQEFVMKLPCYGNEKFSSVIPSYNYEKYVLKSLLAGSLLSVERKRFLGFFSKKSVVLTNRGIRLLEKLLKSKKFYQSDHDWIIHTGFDCSGKPFFLSGPSFQRLNDTFDSHFSDGLTKVSYGGRPTYPKH